MVILILVFSFILGRTRVPSVSMIPLAENNNNENDNAVNLVRFLSKKKMNGSLSHGHSMSMTRRHVQLENDRPFV